MRRTRVAELAGRSVLAALFASFAWAHGAAFAATHRPSLAFAVVTEALLAGFVIVRRPASAVSCSPAAWVTSCGGTFAPLLLRPAVGGGDHLAGTAIQLAGTVAAAAGILYLNRSIGLLPAHRGIRRDGPYRVVRHPLYSAYAITGAGYLANHPSARNAALLAAGLAFQVARLVHEERLLSRDPAYRAYQAETRWRLLPFVY